MRVLVACEESQEVCKADGKWLRYGEPRVAKERAKTFPGIARAMAEQWGNTAK